MNRSLILANVLLAVTPTTSAANQPLSHVTVTVINCAQALQVVPTVKVLPYVTTKNPAPVPIAVVLAQRHLAPGMYSATLDVPPGNYLVTVANGQCHSAHAQSMTIFVGHSRHLIEVSEATYAVLGTQIDSAIGVQASNGITVGLRSLSTKGGVLLEGTTDESVTYFNDLAPGPYLLEVQASNVVACSRVVVPDATYVEHRRLITLDLERLAPYLRAATSREHPLDCDGIDQNFTEGR